MSKLSNVILLLRLLQNGRKYSIKELANELEVSPRMIREYKNELECAGIFIESMRGPYGGYYLNQDIKISENIYKSKFIPINNKEYYNMLSKAINNRNKCYMEYYSKEHDRMTTRVVRPYELLVLDNEWGVAAFCENKYEIRHFYLKRISKLEILDDIY